MPFAIRTPPLQYDTIYSWELKPFPNCTEGLYHGLSKVLSEPKVHWTVPQSTIISTLQTWCTVCYHLFYYCSLTVIEFIPLTRKMKINEGDWREMMDVKYLWYLANNFHCAKAMFYLGFSGSSSCFGLFEIMLGIHRTGHKIFTRTLGAKYAVQ